MSIVFSCLQKWSGFSNGDFRVDGSEFQHVGPETAKDIGPYVTVRIRGKSRSPLVAARSWRRVVTGYGLHQDPWSYTATNDGVTVHIKYR